MLLQAKQGRTFIRGTYATIRNRGRVETATWQTTRMNTLKNRIQSAMGDRFPRLTKQNLRKHNQFFKLP